MDGQLTDLLDRAVEGLPGVLIEVRDGDRTWAAAAGVGDTATGRPRRPEDHFRIGSITKSFVAAVVLGLVDDGLLALDDTVHRLLPGSVRAHADAITVRHLLNHTSGIAAYTDDMERLSGYPTYTPDLLVEIAGDQPPAFAPGAGWAYSNTNYVLLGLIVERVTAEPLDRLVARRIAAEVGLTGTWLPEGDDPTLRAPHSRHYTAMLAPGSVQDITELDPSMFWATGGMVSTAADLNRFFGALLGGDLLSPRTQREMLTTVPTRGWIPHTGYGLGVSSLALAPGITLLGMGGALPGSWTYTYATPDGRHLLTANTNGDWAAGGWDDPIALFTDLLRAEFTAELR